jgi:hypothetical protein
VCLLPRRVYSQELEQCSSAAIDADDVTRTSTHDDSTALCFTIWN